MYERLFTVEEPEGERWDLALELLREGTSVRFRDLVLERREHELHVSVISRYHEPTEAAARAQIDAARQTLDALVSASPGFAAVVGSRTLSFELVNDYGMGAVRLCYVDARGEVQWG